MHNGNMKQDQPKVSVIVPVFNLEEFLPRCLESLLGQTFRDFEILCVDDASCDRSVQIVRMYRDRDSRLRLLQQDHAGVSAARNLGIRNARGTYLLFFDGDDWAEPDMLECLVSAAETANADVTVCSAQVHCDSTDRGTLRRLESLRRNLTVSGLLWETGEGTHCPWEALALPGCWPFVWNKLIRADLIRENRIGFSEQLQLGEDGLFLQILFQYTKIIRCVEPALYHYRYQRKESATVRLFQTQQIRFSQHLGIVRNLCRELHERSLLVRNRDDLLAWTVDFLYADFLRLPGQLQPDASGEILEILTEFDLVPEGDLPDRIIKKRLNRLCRTEAAPSKLLRTGRILQTKIENRLMRLRSCK